MKYWQLKNLLRKVCATGSIDAGTAEDWRGGNPRKVEGGTGALMNSEDTTAEHENIQHNLTVVTVAILLSQWIWGKYKIIFYINK